MKRYAVLALAMALGCTMFTGCRRMGGSMNTMPPATQAVTEMPTAPATRPTEAQTVPATAPTTTTEDTGAATEQSTSGSTEAPGAEGKTRKPAVR